MSRGTFSVREVVKVMVNSGIYEWVRTNGDHAILRWEPQTTTMPTHGPCPSRCTTN